MKTTIISACLLAAYVVLSGDSSLLAQSAAKRHIGFRLEDWRTVHGDATGATAELVSTLQRIGCEVRQDNHGNHIDVAFRCPTWQTLNVETDEQSDQWYRWLNDNKFETVVLNPSRNSRLSTVHVRMPAWRTEHTRDMKQAKAMVATYKLVGCETIVGNHGEHIDVRFRCPNWSTIAVRDEEAAHVWQAWLNKAGFETQHDHSSDAHNAHAGHSH